MGRGQKQRWPGAHKPPWQEPSLQPVEEEASVWGVRLQWQPCSLHITQQQQFASMAWQTFSMSIAGCGTPQSIHSSQHPECAPECRHPSQTGARWAVAQTICVGLKLSCLPQAGCCILLWVSLLLLLFFFFLSFSSISADLPAYKGASPCAGPSPHLHLSWGAQVPSCFLSSSFNLLSLILPSYVVIIFVLLGDQDPLLVFSWCSVRIVPFVDVFLMLLWGKMNSMYTILTTLHILYSVQFSSVAQSCPTPWDPIDCSTPGLPVYFQLPEFIQTHVQWVSDAIQPSHPLSPPSPPAFNISQHQGLFKRLRSSHQVAKV